MWALVEAILATNSSDGWENCKKVTVQKHRFGSVIVSPDSENGKQIKKDVAKIRFRAGDLLLIEALKDSSVCLYAEIFYC